MNRKPKCGKSKVRIIRMCSVCGTEHAYHRKTVEENKRLRRLARRERGA
jgi:ribosomal protein S14